MANCRTAAIFALAAVITSPAAVANAADSGSGGGWTVGRATWYGGPSGPGPDGMSIYTGSCGKGTGLANHMVAAAQTMGGCGARCHKGFFLDSVEGCLDSGKRSVIVQITDSCPCNHPNPGNKRWCCGDALHLDLSYAAFDAIAQRDRGVVDLKVRPADCSKWGQQIRYDSDPPSA